MSFREEQFLKGNSRNFTETQGIDAGKYDDKALRALWRKTLEGGIHGICFSMYEDGQEPGHNITRQQVERRIKKLNKYAKWVRSFSCIEGNEFVPQIAHDQGMKTLVGAWLSDDLEKNELEMEALIDLAQKGFVDIAAIGNEVLYRNDLSKEQLLEYMKRFKVAVPSVPMGYVDAYYEFVVHPELVENSDVILTNCYPFWEGTAIEYSLGHMNDMFHRVLNVSKGKRVIVSETGWPSRGESLRDSHPSEVNAMKYFIDTQQWSKDNEIDVFYFSSFDESWKQSDEGEVGAFWGLWDKHENLKF